MILQNETRDNVIYQAESLDATVTGAIGLIHCYLYQNIGWDYGSRHTDSLKVIQQKDTMDNRQGREIKWNINWALSSHKFLQSAVLLSL